MKIVCTKCKVEKDADIEFHKNSSRSSGYSAHCKACVRENHRSWRERNPERSKEKNRLANMKYYQSSAAKEKSRAKSVRHRYGLSIEEYDAILLLNDGMCMICNQRPATCLDHCHDSGKIRGGLCSKCNIGLGNFDDSVEVMYNAIRYLSGVSPLPDKELKG